MSLFQLGKRKVAGIILFLSMCAGGVVLFKLVEAIQYSELEKNLANSLLSGSQLIRHRALSKIDDWDVLLANNFRADGAQTTQIAYIFLLAGKVKATNAGLSLVDQIKHLNLQKISFADEAYVHNNFMLRSSMIGTLDDSGPSYLILLSQLDHLKNQLLTYAAFLLVGVFSLFFFFWKSFDTYWKNKIIPLHRLRDRVRGVIGTVGFYSREEADQTRLPKLADYLSKSIDHLFHREQELKHKVQHLEVEWENFFQGLSIAAIRLFKHEEKLLSLWGANDHLNQFFTPGMIDPQNPITSMFTSSIEFGSSTSDIQKLILSCYEKSMDEVKETIKQLPRKSRITVGEVEKKLFFTWIPCFKEGSFTSLILEVSNVGLYGQGQENQHVRDLEYQVALDVVRSGKDEFLSVFAKMVEISREIIETAENEENDAKMQLKIKGLIMEFRSALIEAKQDTLSAQFTKLILEVLPTQAFNALPSGSENHNWAQLSPIVVYIVQLAATIAESHAFKDSRTRKISLNYVDLDQLVSDPVLDIKS